MTFIKTESKKNILELLVVGFGLLQIIIGVYLILLQNILPLGLFCFTLGLSIFYIVLSNPNGSQTSEVEIKEIDHALAMSKSIQRGDSGGGYI